MITMPVFPARCNPDMTADMLEYQALNAIDQEVALLQAIEQWNHDSCIEAPVVTPAPIMPTALPTLSF